MGWSLTENYVAINLYKMIFHFEKISVINIFDSLT